MRISDLPSQSGITNESWYNLGQRKGDVGCPRSQGDDGDGSGLGAPSPEGVPKLDRNDAHLFAFAAAFHRRSGLTTEGATGPEGKDGEELRERRSCGVRGVGSRPWGPPHHSLRVLQPPALSHGGHGGTGRSATPQLSAVCASTGAAAGTGIRGGQQRGAMGQGGQQSPSAVNFCQGAEHWGGFPGAFPPWDPLVPVPLELPLPLPSIELLSSPAEGAGKTLFPDSFLATHGGGAQNVLGEEEAERPGLTPWGWAGPREALRAEAAALAAAPGIFLLLLALGCLCTCGLIPPPHHGVPSPSLGGIIQSGVEGKASSIQLLWEGDAQTDPVSCPGAEPTPCLSFPSAGTQV